ncbi:MAG: hypothetical protein GY835_03125, partial [bacterium]|nr:hypothetical protein [bacterium]
VDLLWKNMIMIAMKVFNRTEVLVHDFAVSPGVIIPPGTYEFRNYFVGVQGVPGRAVWPAARFIGGEYYDGTFRTVILIAVIRPVTGLDTRIDYEHTEVDLPAGDFEVDLVTVRATYAFSPRISCRALIQWRRDDNFDANLLFRWIYKPGASFYVAYDEFQDLRDQIAVSSRAKDRALIVKMGFYF